MCVYALSNRKKVLNVGHGRPAAHTEHDSWPPASRLGRPNQTPVSLTHVWGYVEISETPDVLGTEHRDKWFEPTTYMGNYIHLSLHKYIYIVEKCVH